MKKNYVHFFNKNWNFMKEKLIISVKITWRDIIVKIIVYSVLARKKYSYY